jgi:Ni/Fe-hydrogenase subunit HybB-like protein
MGSELIYPIGIALGGLALALLLYLASIKAHRPFAIPTLVAASIWAWVSVPDIDKFFAMLGSFSIEFVSAVAVFGLQAIFIKVALAYWGDDGTPRPRHPSTKTSLSNDNI